MIIRQLVVRYRRLLWFFLVGGLNTILGYALYAMLIGFGLHYPVAVGVSTVIGILVNFQTTGRIVFANRDNSRIFRFLGSYVATYLLNVAFLTLLIRAGIDAYRAGLITAVPVALVSYAILSRLVFRS